MSKEKSLEFDLIKSQLYNYIKINSNKTNSKSLIFIKDKQTLEKALRRTDEASKIVLRFGRLPIEDINDVNEILEKVSKGAVLSSEQLYDIKYCFRLVEDVKEYSDRIDKPLEFQEFLGLVKNFSFCSDLTKYLNKCINDDKDINDDASDNLKKIRWEMKGLKKEIENKLNSLILANKSILTDTNVVYRNDKQVLAVQSTHKYKLGGIIVDESSSGYTSYVEPEAVYKITCKIKLLKDEEYQEILKILMIASNMVNGYYEEIKKNFTALLNLDFMFAKGEYCNHINGRIASVSDDELLLKGARHPLIDEDKVVKNNFMMGGKKNKMLLISGPNTGGKSVALKTIGLLAYMHQCGLAIPIEGEAYLPIFDEIYVDIGDNQSITSSLSTFSSHISNISYILKNISSSSLVLLDEIGNGTDPKEGEALAMAIIDFCHEKGCFLLSTTHYENLKTFAISSNYIDVASMEFDKTNLLPTYRLLWGQVGKSYALYISKRHGLSEDIIDKAYKYKEEYSTSLEKTMMKLENELERQQNLIEQYEDKNDELNSLLTINREKEKQIDLEISKIKEEAKVEKEQLLIKTKEEVKKIVEELKTLDNIKMHHELIANKKIDDLVKEEIKEKEKVTYEINDMVKIVSLNKVGKIEHLNKNKYCVNIGNTLINVDGSDLERVKNYKSENKVVISNKVKPYKIGLELNLISKRVEEALMELDTYIDRARLANLPSVRIIHGYGTGRLQKAIHGYLKQNSGIDSYRFGGANEGGMGVTVVEFKKKVK